VNFAAGALLGFFFGFNGVVAGFVLALVAGSIVILVARARQSPGSVPMDRNFLWLMVRNVLIVAGVQLIYVVTRDGMDLVPRTALGVAVFTAASIASASLHPQARNLLSTAAGMLGVAGGRRQVEPEDVQP
jgi:hypothetical protein